MLDQRLPAGPLRLRRGDRLRGGANSDCDEDDWTNEVESVMQNTAAMPRMMIVSTDLESFSPADIVF